MLVEDLTPYVEAARKVGADEYITCIDLIQMSVAMLKRMTQEQADKFDKGVDPETGKAAGGWQEGRRRRLLLPAELRR